ncbi:MAG: hypothetical protein A2103_05740 [Gammaproteobacteria bacterium GWF2_41_13]|nr:MAG: hypothetical protein A2103_05740 [Gammaproteobacteria bacterium GWF2_41_13]OGT08056.1 MAG: hypothetical protein A2X78_05060 [Gammaproteobacteria bacterium GWE2_37_16]
MFAPAKRQYPLGKNPYQFLPPPATPVAPHHAPPEVLERVQYEAINNQAELHAAAKLRPEQPVDRTNPDWWMHIS